MNRLCVVVSLWLLVGAVQVRADDVHFFSMGAGKTFDGGAQALDSVRLAFGVWVA